MPSVPSGCFSLSQSLPTILVQFQKVGQVPMQREISRFEVEKAIARLKCGKAVGMDGITSQM